MRYPFAAHLPFNSRSIESCFENRTPEDPVPVGNPWYAIIQGSSLVVEESSEGLSLLREVPEVWTRQEKQRLFFGLWQEEPVYAVRIGKDAVIEPPFTAEPYNAVEERLNDRLLSIGGFAQQVLHWENISSICARCGAETEWIAGSWGKRCNACSYDRYPAVHPCAIVLVRRGDEFLLVRKPEWGEGRYGLVAGFLDFGARPVR
jgi:NAD+ diphosphatase